ncbi:MAG: hypothetical protein GXO49_02405 [Chlorobi bacterium]|nr:hypothetical protein [Chlorobiota bacterium]
MLKKISILIIISVFLFENLKAQNPLWTDGTAFTVAKKKLELSIFRPAKYGITKKDQISLHPLGVFVLPHIFYKRQWVKFKLFNQKFLFSSRHGLYYPKIALDLNNNIGLSATETTPVDADVPSSLAIQNELIVSHYLNEPSHCSRGDKLITLRLGFKYAFNFSDYEQALIYKSILYRETIVLTPGLIWYVGADIDGHLNQTFNYFADIDYYANNFVDSWAVESKLGIMGYRGKKISGFAGIKMGLSSLPDKNHFLIMPIAGASYHIDMRLRKKHKTDLFKKGFKHDNSLERDDKYYEMLEKRESLNDSIPPQ